MNKSAELQQRTKTFALRVLKLIEHLPKTIGGRILANHLARSGTSVGANYRAACRARSRAEFASKLGTVAEEADELTAIFTSGRRSASRPQPSTIKPQISSR